MSQSQFALSWDSYKTNICSGFSSFQQNGELVDMTLAADGHLVKVHQVLIALASPYLKDLITTVPTQHPVVFLNNVSHKTLSLILEYIYTGEVRVPAENLSSFMESAKALHIRGLESMTDSGNTTKMETSMNESSLDNTRIQKKSDQINLPLNAKQIYVNVKPDSSTVVSLLKPSDSQEDDMQDYSHNMDDTAHDFDYDVNDDSHIKVNTPSKTENNKSIQALAKDSTCNTNSKLSSNLQFTVSIRGALQVILNRYIYNLHSSQRGGIRRWRCTDYRNKKCSAFLTTKGSVVLNRANPHNHSFHDKKILSKIEKNAVYSALDDVKDLAIVKDKNKDIMTEDSD